MTVKSQDISRRFGAWAIGLINKIRSHLYIYILYATTIAGILSITTWVILHKGAEKIVLTNYEKHATMVWKDIKRNVEDKNLTYLQAVETLDLEKYYKDNVKLLLDQEGNNMEDPKRGKHVHDSILYIFPISYSDGSGGIIISPMIDMLVPKYVSFMIVLISAFVFISMLFLLVRKSIRYIGEIDRSIDIIAGGKLSYKIPVRGKDELARLAANINEMSDQLKERIDVEKEADIKQRQLITNISHDLRTPLTVLTGYLDLLENHNYDTQSEADDFIHCSLKKCNQLQRLIEELFTYNKLVNRDVPIIMEKVDIVGFVKENISQQGIRSSLESKDTEAIVSIDRNLMNRILDNLFDNIRKYGISSEVANIYINKINDKAIIIVENSTNQDLTDKVHNLFERMYIGNESRTDNSSGLGLSIVAEAVRLMNGAIFARFQKPILQVVIEFNEVKS